MDREHGSYLASRLCKKVDVDGLGAGWGREGCGH